MSDKKKLDPALVAKLKSEHGDDLHAISAAGVTVIVRAPRRAEWNQYRSLLLDLSKRALAHEQLARSCTVHPPREELDVLFDAKPALSLIIGDKLVEMAGVLEEVETVKL